MWPLQEANCLHEINLNLPLETHFEWHFWWSIVCDHVVVDPHFLRQFLSENGLLHLSIGLVYRSVCEEDLLDDEFVCGMARADSRMQTAYASNHLMKKSEKEVDRKVDGNESERERIRYIRFTEEAERERLSKQG